LRYNASLPEYLKSLVLALSSVLVKLIVVIWHWSYIRTGCLLSSLSLLSWLLHIHTVTASASHVVWEIKQSTNHGNQHIAIIIANADTTSVNCPLSYCLLLYFIWHITYSNSSSSSSISSSSSSIGCCCHSIKSNNSSSSCCICCCCCCCCCCCICCYYWVISSSGIIEL